MRSTQPELHLPLGHAVPPYAHIHPIPDLHAVVPLSPAPGTVMVVDVRAPAADSVLLPETVAAVRRRFPTAPVVLRLYEATPEAARLAQRADRLRVRAVVYAGEPLEGVLRPILTRPDELGEQVVEWLGLRARALSPVVAVLLGKVVGEAHRFPQLGDLLASIHESERTARHRLRQKGLAPPAAWHQMGRALHGALAVQARPERSVLQVALGLGYCDHSGFSRQMTRCFGVSPARIRGTLGWEWLVDRWMTGVIATRREAA